MSFIEYSSLRASIFCIFYVRTIFIDEVAVIDEIQLIRDPSRGWAWTRALLGISADEIHLCGEVAAIPIVSFIICMLYVDLRLK